MAVRSAPRAGLPLPPGRFLVLISVRGRVYPRAIVRLEGLGQFKNPVTSSGIGSRDLPACSMVPQPTTLLRAPEYNVELSIIIVETHTDRGISACKNAGILPRTGPTTAYFRILST
jgi:hypothetical protein